MKIEITGYDAIRMAREYDLAISVYGESEAEYIDLLLAEEIVRQDPGLVYLDPLVRDVDTEIGRL